MNRKPETSGARLSAQLAVTYGMLMLVLNLLLLVVVTIYFGWHTDRMELEKSLDRLVLKTNQRFAEEGFPEAFETQDLDHLRGRLRYLGCLDAFGECGVDFDPEKGYRGVRFSYQDGYDATRDLIRSGQKFTALFAAADVMAIGAIRALWDEGLKVPEDVSVVGFDGLPLGSFLVPQLSTIAQPVKIMAQRSVEILIQCIEQQGQARHETVPFELYQRDSSRKIG